MPLEGRKYSAGISSGEILLPSFQYERMAPDNQQDFVPVYGGKTVMYRYREAEAIRTPVTNIGNDLFGIMYSEFVNDVDKLTNQLLHYDPEMGYVLFETDGDEDWVEGVLYTAMANLDIKDEFVISHEFDTFYTIQIIPQ